MQTKASSPPYDLPLREFHVEDWLVQPQLNALVREGETTRVEPKVMQVLVYLAERPGEVVSKERLIGAIWAETFVSDQVLSNAIWQLRSVLGRNAIQTIPKAGYRLVAQVFSTPTPQLEQVSAGPVAPGEQPTTNVEHEAAAAKSHHAGARVWMWIAAVSMAVTLGIILLVFYVKVPSHSHGRITLAVLPFVNLSGDSEQEYFSDGITDEMIFQLGMLHPERLSVIARGSAMSYKGSQKRVDEIGKELRAQYIVEGSVRRAGGRVHVTARLIEAASQTQVWAQDYDQSVSDILSVQRDISRSVAEHIRLRLRPDQSTRFAKAQALNEAAYDLYLKGRVSWNQRTRDSLHKAIGYFEQAVVIDPKFAASYVGIADSYWALHEWSIITTADAAAKGMPAVAKALELDPSNAEAHAARAAAAMNYDWDWAGAEKEFKRAIELNPSYASAHKYYAEFLSAMGRPDQAIAEIREAQRLDPYSSMIGSDAAAILMRAGRNEEAIAECQKVLQSNPDFHAAHTFLAGVFYSQGNTQAALREIEKAGMTGEALERARLQIQVSEAVKSGNIVRARKLATHVAALAGNAPNAEITRAALFTLLADKDRAFEHLQKAFDSRAIGLREIKVNFRFTALHSDPRFKDLLARMNLPQ